MKILTAAMAGYPCLCQMTHLISLAFFFSSLPWSRLLCCDNCLGSLFLGGCTYRHGFVFFFVPSDSNLMSLALAGTDVEQMSFTFCFTIPRSWGCSAAKPQAPCARV